MMVGAGTLRAERYGRLVRDPQRREQRVAAGLAGGSARDRRQRPARPAHDLPLLADGTRASSMITA